MQDPSSKFLVPSSWFPANASPLEPGTENLEPARTRRVSTFLNRLAAMAGIARRIVGAPDYERYVAHVRAHHPGAEPLGREEFCRARLEERYNKPGAKCC